MEIHEAAKIYPLLSNEDMKLLAVDIKMNGQREKIKLLGGKIIEGRNRWAACEIAGVAPKTEVIETTEPLAYVHSYNSRRRHLTPSQRSMVAAKEIEYLKRHPGEHALEYSKVLREQEISRRTTKRAQRVIAQGSKEVQEKVEAGEISVREAEEIVSKHTKEQQAALLAKKKEAAGASRRAKKAAAEHRAAPLDRAKNALKKDAKAAFGQLVRSVNALGLFERLYDELDVIRSAIEE